MLAERKALRLLGIRYQLGGLPPAPTGIWAGLRPPLRPGSASAAVGTAGQEAIRGIQHGEGGAPGRIVLQQAGPDDSRTVHLALFCERGDHNSCIKGADGLDANQVERGVGDCLGDGVEAGLSGAPQLPGLGGEAGCLADERFGVRPTQGDSGPALSRGHPIESKIGEPETAAELHESTVARVERDLELSSEILERGRDVDGEVVLAADPIRLNADHQDAAIAELDLELSQVGAHHALGDALPAQRIERSGYPAKILNGDLEHRSPLGKMLRE